MTNTLSHNLLSSLANWNQTSLTEASHPLRKCFINTATLVGYTAIAVVSLIELIAQAILDAFASLWYCKISLTNSKLSINTCHLNGKLIYELFKHGVSRLADLQ